MQCWLFAAAKRPFDTGSSRIVIPYFTLLPVRILSTVEMTSVARMVRIFLGLESYAQYAR